MHLKENGELNNGNEFMTENLGAGKGLFIENIEGCTIIKTSIYCIVFLTNYSIFALYSI